MCLCLFLSYFYTVANLRQWLFIYIAPDGLVVVQRVLASSLSISAQKICKVIKESCCETEISFFL